MRRYTKTSTIIVVVLVLFNLNFLLSINAQSISMCDTSDENNSLGLLCDDEQSLKEILDAEDEDLIPDFDLNQIETEHDANQILKRFRRGRSSSSSGSRSSSSGSRFSSSFGSRSSSSGSSSGSRFFGGSRSSSSSSGGSSRIFSRSSGSSSSSGSGSGSSSSSGSSGGLFSRGSSASSSSRSSGGLFFRGTSSGSSSSSNHRLREAIRSAIRKPTPSGSGTGASKPSITDKIRKITHGGGSSGTGGFGTGGTGGLSGAGGSKPSLSDKIRKITHGGGGSGSGFGMGGSGGSGGNAWVRTGKKFLPVAVRFGKRYYQRRKYNKAIYAGAGAGAGYYAGSRMNQHQGNYYPNNQYDNYGYPPVVDDPPEVDGKKTTVFYCIQEDLNTTLVNKTLDKEGFGVCNISGELVTCPIEIECKTSEADNCCEDEQGTPFCCGGAIPDEYSSQYGGYADDYDAGSDTLHIFTAIWIMMSTICFIIWQRRE